MTAALRLAQEPEASPGLFGFEQALALLKAGRSVRRRRWAPRVEVHIGMGGFIHMRRSRADDGYLFAIDQADVMAEDWESA